ncbi:DUF3298 and DUF4163 domain-containing protein [Formosa algae]|uniref:DUF3298/DUF4163 domain-containing protein n=1 Tax=Formosa algae TaxID=225843 RepID=A0A9X0YP03_9FLAO|nr:DUF3298 and DUF4163 domain-containing protein [Formosa algae]MBP1840368.1 hypothetical protein [Formosa algae]MDQ0334232.1 hypothetical protein [Formosa algae]OEI82224.1 hypothetical protein AST99_00175 [Formosa algae]
MCPKSHSFFIIFCLFVLASCTEKKEITFSEQNITTPNNTIVDINIPKAEGGDNVSVLINESLNQFVETALQYNQEEPSQGSISENIDNFNTEYINFKNQFPESVQEWEAQIDGEVMFKSPDIISISLSSYTNTGGAHGVLVITFLNFNAHTGELITTDKLFKNTEEFISFANPYFNEEISEKEDMYMDPENFILPQNIGYSPDGLILLYNTYEIAPYAAGITEFVIPFSEANSYLNINGI